MHSTKQEGVNRLATTLEAMCGFLSESLCGRCEVLAVCLRRLQEDIAEQGAVAQEQLLRALRQAPAQPALRYRFDCRRCLPAEVLAAYLTPGTKRLPLTEQRAAALS